MAKAKNTMAVGAAGEVKPEETLTAALQAEIEALKAELDKTKAETQAAKAELAGAQERNAELEKALESAVFVSGETDGETLTPEAEAAFTTGSEASAADAEVVAIKSKHGHAFFRAGYHVQPDWTFINRADFEPADFERLIRDRMVVVREALPKVAA